MKSFNDHLTERLAIKKQASSPLDGLAVELHTRALVHKDWTKWNEAKRNGAPVVGHVAAHLRAASKPKPGMAFRFSTALNNHEFNHRTYNKHPDLTAHHAPNAPAVAVEATRDDAQRHIEEANENRNAFPNGKKELTPKNPKPKKKEGFFSRALHALDNM